MDNFSLSWFGSQTQPWHNHHNQGDEVLWRTGHTAIYHRAARAVVTAVVNTTRIHSSSVREAVPQLLTLKEGILILEQELDEGIQRKTSILHEAQSKCESFWSSSWGLPVENQGSKNTRLKPTLHSIWSTFSLPIKENSRIYPIRILLKIRTKSI